MNITKKALIDVSLNQLGKLSIKIAESSMEACVGFGFYETNFPKELLELEEEQKE